jgi:hypothetical protein
MGLTLARIIVAVVLFCLPFALFIAASRKPDNMMFLLFPLFGAVPAIIFALILFVPVEALLNARGMPGAKNIVIPLLGASLVFLFAIGMEAYSGSLGRFLARITEGGLAALAPMLLWSVLGVAWGLIWRSTEWLAKWVGLTNG